MTTLTSVVVDRYFAEWVGRPSRCGSGAGPGNCWTLRAGWRCRWMLGLSGFWRTRPASTVIDELNDVIRCPPTCLLLLLLRIFLCTMTSMFCSNSPQPPRPWTLRSSIVWNKTFLDDGSDLQRNGRIYRSLFQVPTKDCCVRIPAMDVICDNTSGYGIGRFCRSIVYT